MTQIDIPQTFEKLAREVCIGICYEHDDIQSLDWHLSNNITPNFIMASRQNGLKRMVISDVKVF